MLTRISKINFIEIKYRALPSQRTNVPLPWIVVFKKGISYCWSKFLHWRWIHLTQRTPETEANRDLCSQKGPVLQEGSSYFLERLFSIEYLRPSENSAYAVPSCAYACLCALAKYSPLVSKWPQKLESSTLLRGYIFERSTKSSDACKALITHFMEDWR